MMTMTIWAASKEIGEKALPLITTSVMHGAVLLILGAKSEARPPRTHIYPPKRHETKSPQRLPALFLLSFPCELPGRERGRTLISVNLYRTMQRGILKKDNTIDQHCVTFSVTIITTAASTTHFGNTISEEGHAYTFQESDPSLFLLDRMHWEWRLLSFNGNGFPVGTVRKEGIGFREN